MHYEFTLDIGMSVEEVLNFYCSITNCMKKRNRQDGAEVGWEVIAEETRSRRESMLEKFPTSAINVAVLNCEKKQPMFISEGGWSFLCAIPSFPFLGFAETNEWPLLCFGVQNQKYFEIPENKGKWVAATDRPTHYTPKYCSACGHNCWDESNPWFPAVSAGALTWGLQERHPERILVIKPK